MHRLPTNRNLSLYDEATYMELPLMIGKGPFIEQYLDILMRTIDLALDQYPRILAFRVDLHLPQGVDLPDYVYTNEVISDFIESYKAKIKHNRDMARRQRKYIHDCRVRYVWAREIGEGGQPHYHLLIILNRDAYYTVGRLASDADNMINRMQEAWASALGLFVDETRALVHICENAEYRVDRCPRPGDEDELPALFERASYLCKAATKSYGYRHHGFGHSRR